MLEFPEYPSLTKTAEVCNVSILLPPSSVFDGGTVSGFSYSCENLQGFVYSPANLFFSLGGVKIQIADVSKLERAIKINEFEDIDGVDSYEIMNKGDKSLSYFEVSPPLNATKLEVTDQFG